MNALRCCSPPVAMRAPGSTSTEWTALAGSRAEMADPDPSVRALLAKSLGSEDAAGTTLKPFGSALEDYDYTVFAYRPDLSTQ